MFVLNLDLFFVLFKLIIIWLILVCVEFFLLMIVFVILLFIVEIVFNMFLFKKCDLLLLCNFNVLWEFVDVLDGVVVRLMKLFLRWIFVLIVGLLWELMILWLIIFIILVIVDIFLIEIMKKE